MIKAKYNKDRQFDELLSGVIKSVDYALSQKDDDFLVMCSGTTGTGKSMLMLHAMEEYMGDKATVELIGLDNRTFSHSLKVASVMDLPRFCGNDEANINKRNSLTKYNKDVLDLYLAIRGLKIFHWWNNPSIDMIDKPFIEERIKGFIYIKTKDKDRPRIYYYFRKKELLELWEKYGNLKLNLLHKKCKEYAYFRGWFRDYKGFLKQPYLDKKKGRMKFKIDDFFEKYGKEKKDIGTNELSKKINVSNQTLKNYTKKLLEKGVITNNDVYKSPTGYWRYKESAIQVFIEEFEKNKKKAYQNLKWT